MQIISQLYEFLISLNLVAAEQIDGFVDDLQVTPAFRETDQADVFVLAVKDYTATFYIERYPFGQVGENELLAQISSWIIQQDAWWEVNQADFSVIIDVSDNQVADIELGIKLREHVTAKQDDAGSVVIDGMRYALC